MMHVSDMYKKYKANAKKVAAAYAAYEASKTTATKLADKFCHELKIDQDYNYSLHCAAAEAINEFRVWLPTMRRKDEAHLTRSDYFHSPDWVPVRIPGKVRLIQARAQRSDEIEFRSPLQRELDAMREYLDEKVAEQEKDTPEFDPFSFTPTTNILSWHDGSWDFRQERNARSFGTVFLPRELQDEIEADLRAFTESRERLKRLELPWRRGYLLSGPPGTGKTSLSLAIAGTLNFQLASLSLTDIKSDGELRQAVSQLRKRTVLVIEDIDAYSISHDRDHNTAKDGELSLSGLLNALDGFETPEGLVTICTTNHIEHLDPALIRSGRLDRNFHLGHIEAPELDRLFKWFYEIDPPHPAPEDTVKAKIAPAEINEAFKQHLDDPAAGWASVMFMVEGGQLEEAA
jgi:SpoVK/Ycf46/Vps4 family AAA+-type ATPase